MKYFVSPENEKSFEEIFKNISPEIADMGIIIDGRTAGVEFYFSRNQWLERFYFSAYSVKKLYHNSIIKNNNPRSQHL